MANLAEHKGRATNILKPKRKLKELRKEARQVDVKGTMENYLKAKNLYDIQKAKKDRSIFK